MAFIAELTYHNAEYTYMYASVQLALVLLLQILRVCAKTKPLSCTAIAGMDAPNTLTYHTATTHTGAMLECCHTQQS